ncbi:MAG: Cys-tRNA(Pro) deacylase [Lachnospiraceae bacterium]|nr:Cys-tRNA(Pro) deacylase [Lachnospiraceae bacterium]
MVKTNVMRKLDQKKISYETAQYEVDESDLSGVHAAALLGVNPEMLFKTLVAKGERKGYCVFCIPVAEELDLKKCAAACGDKRVEMLPLKDLTAVTGYIRGGCSPIGMKKQFPTFIHQSAKSFEKIGVSAGLRGEQIFLAPDDLAVMVGAKFADLIHENT